MKRILITIILALQATFTYAQDADANFWHNMFINNFQSADFSALIQVDQCSIADTMHMYTIQRVDGRIIHCYKGCTDIDRISYYAMVETKKQWLTPGKRYGVFLLAGKEKDSIYYSWIENSGFREQDTAFLRSLTNEDTLYDKIAASFIGSENKPQWIKAKINTIKPDTSSELYEVATLQVTEVIKANKFLANKTYTVALQHATYNNDYHLSKLIKGREYYFPLIWDEPGFYYTSVENVLPRLSPQMIRKLKRR